MNEEVFGGIFVLRTLESKTSRFGMLIIYPLSVCRLPYVQSSKTQTSEPMLIQLIILANIGYPNTLFFMVSKWALAVFIYLVTSIYLTQPNLT